MRLLPISTSLRLSPGLFSGLLAGAVAATLAVSGIARAEDAPAADAPATDAAAADPADKPAEAEAAEARQRVEERVPRPGTPLISNKLYPMQFRFEFGAAFDKSFADKYVDHIGGHANIGFHIFDWLAIEGFGGYLVGDETGIVGNVRVQGKSTKEPACFGGGSGPCNPQLPDLWMATWFAGANVQWAPIYGKLSAVSEYDLNFQLYLRGGAGVEGIQRQDVLGAYVDQGIRFNANYGLGIRLIPFRNIALRAEVVNYTGLNPNVEEHNATDETSCPDGFSLANARGEETCNPDLTTNTMFQVGVSFIL